MGIVTRNTSAFGVTAKGANLTSAEMDTNLFLLARGLGLNTVTITSATTLTSTLHEGRGLIFNSATPFTTTIALQSAGGPSVLGAKFYGVNMGAGTVTLTIQATGVINGVTENTMTLDQWGTMEAVRIGTNEYSVSAGATGYTGSQGSAGTGISLQGSVDIVDDLPGGGNTAGDAYVVTASGHLYVWDGAAWGDTGPIVGYTGSAGGAGAVGYTGSRGVAGYAGSQGYAGSRGTTGAVGATGIRGYTGSQGYAGSRGYNGSIGYTGSSGSGYVGSAGSLGYTGSMAGGPAPYSTLFGAVGATPIVLDLAAAYVTGPFFLNINPDTGCTVFVEVSYDSGTSWMPYDSVDSFRTALFDVEPGSNAAFPNRVKLTRTIGTGTSSRYSVGTVVASQPQSSAYLSWTGAPTGNAPVGTVLTAALATGVSGTIKIQRNGQDIAGAISASTATSLLYTVVTADAGTAIAPVAYNLQFTSPPIFGGTPSTNPPVLYSALVGVPADTVILTYSQVLNSNSVPAPSQFTIPDMTVTGVAIPNDGSGVVQVITSTPFVGGQVSNISYTVPATNPIQSASGTATNISSYGIYNTLTPPAYPITSMANFSTSDGVNFFLSFNSGQSNGDTFGRINVPTNPSPITGNSGGAHAKALGACWIEMKCVDTFSSWRMIGLYSDGMAAKPYITVRLSSGTVTPYYIGVAGVPYTFPTVGQNCKVRVNRAYPTGLITMDTSEDGGATWTTRYTYTTSAGVPVTSISDMGVSSLQTYASFNGAGTGTVPLVAPAVYGFQPAY